MTSVNVFGERICDKACPAYHIGEYGELCNAKLGHYGRVKPVDGEIRWGMVCSLPVGFKIVVDE